MILLTPLALASVNLSGGPFVTASVTFADLTAQGL
jgi:hypothetical protein